MQRVAAAKKRKPMNVKKGQFMAPWDMTNVVEKLREVGNRADHAAARAWSLLRLQHPRLRHARALEVMKRTGCSGGVRRDALRALFGRARHVVGRRPRDGPGPGPGSRGGRRRGRLSRDSSRSRLRALSDGPNMMPLKAMEALLRDLVAFDRLAKA